MASVIATGMVVFFGVPITLATAFAPSLQPIGELVEGTVRVAAGDFAGRLPVDQDDDLGVVAASFNRMQDGLAERQRLQSAFGSYVDPSLAERLLAQGDELFSGERVEVTVMFADIRNFTPFAEANTAEDAVAHLNALFEIVVATVNAHGGHVNKFLGDGAMIVFGAPERIDDHADQAVAAAVDIQRQIETRFNGSTSVGIGINTGTVIAGTIGGAGKLEFTLIGDAVNVAARVEQLTKTTSDAILITEATATALHRPSSTLHDRGAHDVKGKSEPIRVHALDPHEPLPA
jgi:class 3 adenylate cyclase